MMVYDVSTIPGAATTTQTDIWCNIFIALVLSRFCLPQWKGYIRAACLQNETAPEKFLDRYEKRFEKREKGSEKRSETRLKKF